MAFAGRKGNPLTLLLLQKDVWKSVESKSKKEILDKLKQTNRTITWTITKDVYSNKTLYIQASNGH